MNDRTAFDFAIFGATPLAQLLAGLLASAHGKTVILFGEGQSGYRLARNLDLSVAPVTRPDSWALLTATAPEAIRLIGRIGGRGATVRVDPIFFAEGQEPVGALAHMRHMAAAFGIAAEPVAPSLLGQQRSGTILRDAVRIVRPALEPGLESWLEKAGVVRAKAQKVTIAMDGQAEVLSDDMTYRGSQTILADDEAIMAYLPLRQWPPLLRRRQNASVFTTPTQPLAASIMFDCAMGITMTQQVEGGIAAFGPGDMAQFSAHLQGLLGQSRRVEQAGQTSFQSLVSTDGAPVLGRVGGVGADIVAGLGFMGAFLTPALARWLVGEATKEEAVWFGGRLANRTAKSEPVDDYIAGVLEAAL